MKRLELFNRGFTAFIAEATRFNAKHPTSHAASAVGVESWYGDLLDKVLALKGYTLQAA